MNGISYLVMNLPPWSVSYSRRMCSLFLFCMYSHVEASGVRKRFCDWALPETWRSPNRSVAPADRGDTPSPTVVRSPARTITHRRRHVMFPPPGAPDVVTHCELTPGRARLE